MPFRSAPPRAGLDAPGDHGARDGLAGLGVAPVIAGPGAGKGQTVGAHMILAQHIAGDIYGWLAFAGEVVET